MDDGAPENPADTDTADTEDPDDSQTADSASGSDTDDSGRRCHNCGESLTRYSKFCSSCGAEQDLAADRPGEEIDSEATEQPHSSGSRSAPGPSGQNRSGRAGGRGGRAGAGDTWGDQQEQGGGNRRGPGPQTRQQGGPRNQQRGTRQSGGPRGQQQQARGGPRQQTRQPAGQPDRTVTAGPTSDTDMAAVTHILGLFTGLLGTLLIYVVTDDPFVKQNAANATNWQIMVIIYSIVSFVLIFLLVGFILLPALVLADFAFAVIAAIKATDGEAWEYPITPELV